MPGYLLACSIGPIQSFIAAARRTRDFWFGSHLLSEISRAAARALPEDGLIFPATARATQGNIANIILAEVATDPEAAAKAARDAAVDCWKTEAENARAGIPELINQPVWNEQLNDSIVEFYAAWTPLSDDYPLARRRVMQLLGARKALRDFPSAPAPHPRLPKSSLDGARETVWADPAVEVFTGTAQKQLRRSEGEQLDVIGVTKRLGGGRRSFPSVARIAADPWLRGVAASDDAEFEAFVNACASLDPDTLPRVGGRWPQFRSFPYDGTPVYRSRHPEWKAETQEADAIAEVAVKLGPLEKRYHEPEPYLAILAADGDRMGGVIDNIGSSPAHRDFSRRLADFAGEAESKVGDHSGALVYSGGDDVLAFLPVDRCLGCARALRECFCEHTAGYRDRNGESPTLSVGLAIVHFMDPLEDLFGFARSAEKAAKDNDRDSLAVHVHTRSGPPLKYVAKWGEDPDRRIAQWAELLSGGFLPDKAAYDLRRVIYDYRDWSRDNEADSAAVKDAMCADALRQLVRKRTSLTRQALAQIESLIQDAATWERMEKIAREILVARRIGRAMEQAKGRRT